MAKDPAFLFYYQDFLVGTTFLSQAERGVYITILCHLADKGALSEEEIICLCNGVFSDKIKSKLEVNNEGKYYNKRLLDEVIKRKEYAISRKNNRLGKKKKKKHMKKICKSYLRHMEDGNEDINEDENKYLYLKNKTFKEAFVGFIEMRKKIKKPTTKRAREIILKKLTKHDIEIAQKMLEQSILHNWQDVYNLKEEQDGKNRRGSKSEYAGLEEEVNI